MKKYKNETKNLIITGTMRHLYVHFYWGKKGGGAVYLFTIGSAAFPSIRGGTEKNSPVEQCWCLIALLVSFFS